MCASYAALHFLSHILATLEDDNADAHHALVYPQVLIWFEGTLSGKLKPSVKRRASLQKGRLKLPLNSRDSSTKCTAVSMISTVPSCALSW